MHESDDFYLQHVAQVRLDRWSSGRVTVVGDAGYAPSPFAGMGTSLAFIGAYVLAGEISRQPNDIPAALESYERVLRPYVESIQQLPPGVPWIALPQSTLGVRVFQTIYVGCRGAVQDVASRLVLQSYNVSSIRWGGLIQVARLRGVQAVGFGVGPCFHGML